MAGANYDDGMVPCLTCNPDGAGVVAHEKLCGRCFFGHVRPAPLATLPPTPSLLSQMNDVARNVGVDLNCGSCASLFFTGYGGYDHDASCSKKPVKEGA
jgi:hypothetical protein